MYDWLVVVFVGVIVVVVGVVVVVTIEDEDDEPLDEPPPPPPPPLPPPEEIVIVIVSLAEVDILPAASLAQAYRVFEPEDEKVYEVGADADQPLSPVDGVVADSFTRYPVTPVASVAVRDEIDTVSDDAVAGTVNAVMVGAVESDGTAGVTALEADEALEFPTEFVATTVNVYDVPLVNPVMV